MSNTKNTAAAVTNVAAAPVKSTKRTAKNTNTNAADNAAAVVSPETPATNAAPVADNTPAVFPEFTPVQVLETAAEWIRKYETISNIRDNYKELITTMGKNNYSAVLKQAQTTRAQIIENAAAVVGSWFNGTNILAAVMGALNKEREYTALCGYARRNYEGTPAEIAARIIADYYTAVDNNGNPLQRVSYINASGTEIYVIYERKPITHANAVQVLKLSLDNMGKCAKNAVTRSNGNDNAAAVKNNRKDTAVIVAVYAAALDETEHATIGTRRDNSKDTKTAENAAKVTGKSLPVGCVPVSVWNAAKNGNETAADIVAAAHDAAKDAAAKVAARK